MPIPSALVCVGRPPAGTTAPDGTTAPGGAPPPNGRLAVDKIHLAGGGLISSSRGDGGESSRIGIVQSRPDIHISCPYRENIVLARVDDSGRGIGRDTQRREVLRGGFHQSSLYLVRR